MITFVLLVLLTIQMIVKQRVCSLFKSILKYACYMVMFCKSRPAIETYRDVPLCSCLRLDTRLSLTPRPSIIFALKLAFLCIPISIGQHKSQSGKNRKLKLSETTYTLHH